MISASANLDKSLASEMDSRFGVRLFQVSLCGAMCSSVSRKLAVSVRVDAITLSVSLRLVSDWVYKVFVGTAGGCVPVSLIFSKR